MFTRKLEWFLGRVLFWTVAIWFTFLIVTICWVLTCGLVQVWIELFS